VKIESIHFSGGIIAGISFSFFLLNGNDGLLFAQPVKVNSTGGAAPQDSFGIMLVDIFICN